MLRRGSWPTSAIVTFTGLVRRARPEPIPHSARTDQARNLRPAARPVRPAPPVPANSHRQKPDAGRAQPGRFLKLTIELRQPEQVCQGSNLVTARGKQLCVAATTIKQGALPRVRQAIQQLLPPHRAARHQLQVSVHIGPSRSCSPKQLAPSVANPPCADSERYRYLHHVDGRPALRGTCTTGTAVRPSVVRLLVGGAGGAGRSRRARYCGNMRP